MLVCKRPQGVHCPHWKATRPKGPVLSMKQGGWLTPSHCGEGQSSSLGEIHLYFEEQSALLKPSNLNVHLILEYQPSQKNLEYCKINYPCTLWLAQSSWHTKQSIMNSPMDLKILETFTQTDFLESMWQVHWEQVCAGRNRETKGRTMNRQRVVDQQPLVLLHLHLHPPQVRLSSREEGYVGKQSREQDF